MVVGIQTHQSDPMIPGLIQALRSDFNCSNQKKCRTSNPSEVHAVEEVEYGFQERSFCKGALDPYKLLISSFVWQHWPTLNSKSNQEVRTALTIQDHITLLITTSNCLGKSPRFIEQLARSLLKQQRYEQPCKQPP